jgi:cell division septal protein FtsQ
MHLGHSHVFFIIFNYFSLIDIFMKKLNSKKYIFDAFVSISFFLITFLIKLMLFFFICLKSKIKKIELLGDHVTKKDEKIYGL